MSGNGRRTTLASRRPLPDELKLPYQRSLRVALAFARLMLDTRTGLLPSEIAARLHVSVRHAHRLIRAAELAGWPMVPDEERRWSLVKGAR